ncbi:MAG: sigma 54-interacting transcriptional regulator [Archangiaceae bacterium]|nr:sigma 54-interacting transcriptional regulator [Archangiaceae bacterium]
MNAPLVKQESALPHHATRVPLYVPCVARPQMRDCWLVNLSATGLALVATLEDGAAAPEPGAEIDIEFSLPGAPHKIRAQARLAWAELVEKDGTRKVWVGAAFVAMPATDRSLLAQHIAAYRPLVVMAFASREEQGLCDLLGDDVVWQHSASLEELRETLGRGDVSAVVVFGQREEAVAAVELIAGGSRRWAPQHRPGVIYCAEGEPTQLLRLHNEGKLFESLDRPINLQVLATAVQHATQDHAVRSELQRASHHRDRLDPADRPRSAGKGETHALADIVYVGKGMQRVIDLLQIIAPQRLPVLLLGETGTGKELLARAVHGLSDRSKEAFVVQDCGLLAETLLESELFGHVKGAFTGAVSDHPGLFRVADRGTIVLDEIENTTPALQAKLLRVIEAGEVRPVGGTRSVIVDVRVVAASNRNLLAEVDAGRFRADLFYRLSPFPIDVPALRERREDVMPLAHVFLKRATVSLGRRVAGFTPEAEALLMRHEFRGNVRELRNIVERAVLLAPAGKKIRPSELPEALQQTAGGTARPRPGQGSLKDRVTQYEREVMREALERNNWVLRRAAAELQTNPMTLGRRAKQLGLWPLPITKPAA